MIDVEDRIDSTKEEELETALQTLSDLGCNASLRYGQVVIQQGWLTVCVDRVTVDPISPDYPTGPLGYFVTLYTGKYYVGQLAVWP